jgi:hypothetical protein
LIKAEETGFKELRARRERSEGTIKLGQFSIDQRSLTDKSNNTYVIEECQTSMCKKQAGEYLESDGSSTKKSKKAKNLS